MHDQMGWPMAGARQWSSAQGKYAGIEPVSERQFVTVWRVRDEVGRERLLEELRLADVTAWADVDRFERATTLLQQLNHPAIPSYVDALRNNDTLCVVTEAVRGQPIRARLAVATTLSAAVVVDLLRQGLLLLADLHGRQPPVLHRDLSPDTVWIATDAAGALLSVTGFGAAQFGQTSGMSAVGTFGTLAPEQAAGHAVPASDLYGLGMTLLALASQRAPENLLDAENGTVQFAGIAALPERARAVIEAMVRPDVARRLQSAQAGLAVLAGRAPLSSIGVAPPRKRFHRLVSAVLAVVVATCAVWGYGQVPSPGEVATLGGWFTGHGSWPVAVSFSSRGAGFPHPEGPTARVASLGYKDDLFVWQTDGSVVARSNRDREIKHASHLVMSPDGAAVLVCGAHDVAILRVVGDVLQGQGFQVATGHACQAVTWASRPLALVGPRLGVLNLVDASSNLVIQTIAPPLAHTWAAAIAGDAPVIAVASGQNPEGPLPEDMAILLQDTAGSRVVRVAGPVGNLQLSADGRWLAVGLYDAVVVVDVAAGVVTTTHQGADLGAWTRDGRLLALAHNGQHKHDKPTIDVVERNSGRVLATFTGHGRSVRGMAFSADGQLLATASKDGRVKLWKVP